MDEPPPYLAVVIGARSLCDDAEKTAWSRHWIECVLDHADGLATGDADGPDEWSVERATACTYLVDRVRRYCLDGTVRDAHANVLARWCADANTPALSPPRDPSRPWRRWPVDANVRRSWPLARNEALMRAVALRVKRDGRKVEVFALTDPDSRTAGTWHAVKVARNARLTVRVETFDRDRWRADVAAWDDVMAPWTGRE